MQYKPSGIKFALVIVVLFSGISNSYAQTVFKTSIFGEVFESGGSSWTITGSGIWQIGNPTSGPSSGYNSTNCAATNLSGYYTNSANEWLISPLIALPSLTGDSPQIKLSFQEWYNIESGFDHGRIKVSTNGGSTWVQVDDRYGTQTSWVERVVDLTSYADQTIQIAFNLTTDGSVTRDGWFIDDIEVYKTQLVSFGGAHLDLDPAANAQNTPAQTDITIDFNWPVDASTISDSTIQVVSDASGTVAGSRDYLESIHTVVFTPAAAFTPGDSITVTISGALQDTAGIGFDGDNDGTAEGDPIDNYVYGFTIGTQNPTAVLDSIAGHDTYPTNDVTVNYTTGSPTGSYLTTANWEYSRDGIVWNSLDESAISDNSPKLPGSSTITWSTTTGSNNLQGIYDSSVWFRMKAFDGNYYSYYVTSDSFAVDNNLPPGITVDPLSGEQSDNININYTLTDTEGDTLSIVPQYSLDQGATWLSPTVSGKTDSIAPGEYAGALVWSSESDLSAHYEQADVVLRITPSDNRHAGSPDTTNSFEVDNNDPSSIVLTTPTGALVDTLTIEYILSDAANDSLSIFCEYSTDAGATWHEATVYGETTGIVPSAYSGSIQWLSHVDLPSIASVSIRFRITPSDNDPGTSGQTINFGLVNNAPPSVTISFQAQMAGETTIGYSLSDSEDDVLSLQTSYSTDGSSWSAATSTGLTSGITAANYASAFAWLSGTDLPGHDDTIYFKVVPVDAENGAGTAGTVSFNLDTRPPDSLFATGASGDTTFTFSFDEVVAESTATNTANISLSGGLTVGSISVIPAEIVGWTTKATMPTRRRDAVAEVIDDQLYVAGGYYLGYLNALEVYDPATDSWTTKASMPTFRQEAASGVINGKLYVAGGYRSGYLGVLEEYDPATDSWTTKASMPTARNNADAGVINGKLYVAGGYRYGYLRTLEEYDPTTNSWTPRAAMPTARDNAATGVIDGKLYVVGGYGSGGYLNVLEVYDPATDSWDATKASMPTAREYLVAGVIDGKLYVGGGYNGTYLSVLEVYDPATDSWTMKDSMPTVRREAVAGAINGRLYIAGGFNGSYLTTLEAYNTRPGQAGFEAVLGAGQVLPPPETVVTITAASIADQYQNVIAAPMQTSINTTSGNPPSISMQQPSGTISGDVSVDYVISDAENSLISLHADYSTNAGSSWWSASVTGDTSGITSTAYSSSLAWQSGTDLSGQDLEGVWFRITPRDNEAVWGLSDTVVVSVDNKPPEWIAATGSSGDTTFTFSFDEQVAESTATDTANISLSGGLTVSSISVVAAATIGWTSKASMPNIRRESFAGVINGKLYVAGGWDGSYLSILEVYNPATDSWETKASMPTVRRSAAAAVIDGKLYVVGGFNTSYLTVLEVYDPATDSWTTKAPMSTGRDDLVAGVINGKLYVAGGFGNGIGNELEVYDPATNIWTTKASMPTTRDYAAAGVIGGKLYVAGGYSAGYLSVLEIYDPATNSWTTGASMLSAKREIMAGAINGKLYVAGGYTGSYLSELEEYDPATDSWTAKGSMPTARRSAAAGVIGSKLYIAGGYDVSYLGTLEFYDALSTQAGFKAVLGIGQRLPPPDSTVTVTAANIADPYQNVVTAPLQTSFNPTSGDPPSIALQQPSDVLHGDAKVSYTIADAENNLISLHADFSTDTGTNWQAATVTGDTSNIAYTSYSGSLSWQSGTDLGGQDLEGIWLRITPRDNEAAQGVADTIIVDVDNKPPEWIAATGSSGDTTITFWFDESVEDSTATKVSNFTLTGGLTADSIAVVAQSDTFAFYLTSGQTLPPPPAQVTVTASNISDTYGNTIPAALDTILSPETGGLPSIALQQPSDVLHGDAKISYTIADAENNLISLHTDYSTDAGLNWQAASVTGDTSNIAYTAYSGSLLWQSGTDLDGQDLEGVWFRMTPRDKEAVWGVADTIVVDVDNKPPEWIAATGASGDTTFTFSFDEQVTESSATNPANISLSGGLTVSSISVVAATTVGWTTKASMPTARRSAAVGVINGKLYVAGGYNFLLSYLSILEVYNPATDSWETKASMPTARREAVSGVIGGKLYVVGGYNDSYPTELEVYDPATDSWTTKASMPTPRREAVAGVIDGKLYVAGGYWSGYLYTMEVYDPATDSWTTKASMPNARYDAVAGVIDGKLYVAGGYSTGYLSLLQIYDPATNSWTTKASMPTARREAVAGVIDGKLYVTGGYGSSGYLSVLEVYDPATDSWTTEDSMPTARDEAVAGVIDSKLYVAGGYGGSYLSILEVYNTQSSQAGFEAVLGSGQRIPPPDTTITVTAANIADPYQNVVTAPLQTSFNPTSGDPPSITLQQPSGTAYGDVEVGYTITDTENNLVSLHTDYSTDAGTNWQAATVTGDTSYIAYTSYSGSLSWRSGTDLGGQDLEGIWLRITPRDNETASGAADTIFVDVDNKPPEWIDATGSSGDTTITFWFDESVADSTATKVSNFTLTGGLAADSIAVVAPSDTFALYLTSGQTLPPPPAQVTVTASNISDIYGNTIPTSLITAFNPDTGELPSITLQQPSDTVQGDVEVSYTIADAENNTISLYVDYSTDAGSIWLAATVTGNTSNIVYSAYDGSLFWRSGIDLGGQELENVWFRITPRDNETTSGVADTVVVSLDNKPPEWITAIGASGDTTFTFSFDEPVSESTAINAANYSLSDGLIVESISAGVDTAGGWTTKASMPTTRRAAAAGVIGNKLYVAGGYNISYLTALEVYDPATDSWTTRASMPTTRRSAAAGVIDGKLYVVGGYNNSYLTVLEVYDPATDSWTTKAPMSTGRDDLVAGVINGKLYVAGGFGSGSGNELEVYDPATDSWTTKASMPTARDYAVAGIIGGKLYVAGGYSGGYLSVLEIYDPTTDSWTTGVSMPFARSEAAAGVIDGKLNVAGGNNGNYLTELEEYDPATDSWTAKDSMPTARRAAAAGVIGSKLYIAGGYDGSYLSTLEVYHTEVGYEAVLRSGQTLLFAWYTLQASNIQDIHGNEAGVLSVEFLPRDDNSDPAISLTPIDVEVTGDVVIDYLIFDTEGNAIRLIPDYSVDGGSTWSRATTSSDTLNIIPSGYDDSITWFTMSDLPAGSDLQDVQFRITPSDNDLELGQADVISLHIDNNEIPSISITSTIYSDLDPTSTFNYQLSDAESDTLSLQGEYSADAGVTWLPATTSSATSGITESNYIGSLVWENDQDLSGAVREVLFRITPSDIDEGVSDTAIIQLDALGVPSVTIDSTYTAEQRGNVTIPFTIADDQGDQVSLYAEFLDTGGTWQAATVIGDTISLTTAEYSGSLVWDSVADLAGADMPGAGFCLTPYDANPGFTDTLHFYLDNNAEPSVVVAIDGVDQYRELQINYTLTDIEGDALGIQALYSTDSGTAWNAMTLSAGDTAGISSGNYSGQLTWDSYEDLGYGEWSNVLARLVPHDFETGIEGLSSAFNVKNYIGDFSGDGQITNPDFMQLVSAYNLEDAYYDIGPATGTAPNLTINHDGVIDFEDLAVFIVMWNWRLANPGQAEAAEADRVMVKPTAAERHQQRVHSVELQEKQSDDPWASDNGILDLELKAHQVTDVMGVSVLIDYDSEHLRFLNLEPETFLGRSGGNKPTLIHLQHMDEEQGRLSLLLGRLNREYPDVSGSGLLASLHFAKLSRENSDVTVAYELWDRGGDLLTAEEYQTEVYALRIPAEFALLQNYPNPFNGETVIRFQLPGAEKVQMHIFNVRGQRVATLIDERMDPGYHKVTWSGRNDQGRQVASGIYIYLIQAGRHRQSKKLTIIK